MKENCKKATKEKQTKIERNKGNRSYSESRTANDWMTHGVAMGSPFAPVLANIFMGFDESKCLNEYNLNKTKFYLRYVDNILAAFDNKQDSFNFLNFLNNKHSNNKFTIGKQINHSTGVNNQNLTLQTYHKSTYLRLLLNFNIFTSFSYMISLIKCLIDRVFKIRNNWNSFHNDVKTLNPILLKM